VTAGHGRHATGPNQAGSGWRPLERGGEQRSSGDPAVTCGP
jgi:hypothetical protein